MRGLYAIYRKEISHYFVSPVGYAVVPIFLILSAVFFNMYLAEGIKASFEASMEAMQGGAAIPFDVPSAVMGAFLSLVGTILLFLTPLLTMGVYSEERKRGTMELLLTSPITDWQIVLGKFFASVSLFIIMILPTVLYVVYMFAHSEPVPPWKLIAGGYLGVLLLGATLLAIGSFLSALTENQIVAGVLVLGISLLLWVVGFFAGTGNGLIAQTLQYVAILQHYNPFVRGVIDTTGLIFFGSWIFFAIFLTMRAVDSMRWRRA